MKVSWYISTFGGFQSIGVPQNHPLVCEGILHLWNAHVNFLSFICPSSFQTWPCRWGVKDSQCPGFSPVFWKSIGGPFAVRAVAFEQQSWWENRDVAGVSLGFYGIGGILMGIWMGFEWEIMRILCGFNGIWMGFERDLNGIWWEVIGT